MKPLTGRQQEILEFVVAFQKRMGRTPTGPEIANEFGFSDHSSAYQHLRALEQKGYLKLIQPGKKRAIGIRLSEQVGQLLGNHWPLLGAIPAGPLSEVLDEERESMEKIEDLVPGLKPGDYFLMVEGDSMIDAGLQPGQYVVLRPNVTPSPGDICAVWVNGEGGTLKYVYLEDDLVKLVPANPRYKPKSYPPEEVRIQGVLVAGLAVRKFK